MWESVALFVKRMLIYSVSWNKKAGGHLVWPQQVGKFTETVNEEDASMFPPSRGICTSCRFLPKLFFCVTTCQWLDSGNLTFMWYSHLICVFSVSLLSRSCPFWQWFFHPGSCVVLSCHVFLVIFNLKQPVFVFCKHQHFWGVQTSGFVECHLCLVSLKLSHYFDHVVPFGRNFDLHFADDKNRWPKCVGNY